MEKELLISRVDVRISLARDWKSITIIPVRRVSIINFRGEDGIDARARKQYRFILIIYSLFFLVKLLIFVQQSSREAYNIWRDELNRKSICQSCSDLRDKRVE